MSSERRPTANPQRKKEGGGPTSTATEQSPDAVSSVNFISESEPNTALDGSHPGLLALARILGRSAARADTRRTRRGAIAIMGPIETLLLAAAVAAAMLMWDLFVVLR